jgi:phosphoglucosamine mutase
MKKLFGTDGIRGVAGEPPLDRATAYAVGVALARWIDSKKLEREVVIGMDTRESGLWLAEHVAGGLAEGGVKTRFAGLITTPGVAYVTKTGPFSAGIMISASHNPYEDNGIKVVGHSGFKLPDDEEKTIEASIFERLTRNGSPAPVKLKADEGLDRSYTQFLETTLPQGLRGLKMVVDGANGSATYLGPTLFEELGAQVERISCNPDGRNINLNCGSQHLEGLRERVLSTGADLGVAFDGDADRALFVSHSGKIVDGDAVMLLCAIPLRLKGKLTEVVATVMSNIGLELALKRHGIGMVRTAVGDKYVLEEMLRRDAILGGEQSGHVIFREYATTGDGLLTALRVLDVMHNSGRDLDALTEEFKTFPQKLVNVRVKERKPLEGLDQVQSEIRRAQEEFGEAGRVVVRFSGTEPLARVMVEGPSDDRVDHFCQTISAAIRQELGA